MVEVSLLHSKIQVFKFLWEELLGIIFFEHPTISFWLKTYEKKFWNCTLNCQLFIWHGIPHMWLLSMKRWVRETRLVVCIDAQKRNCDQFLPIVKAINPTTRSKEGRGTCVSFNHTYIVGCCRWINDHRDFDESRLFRHREDIPIVSDLTIPFLLRIKIIPEKMTS